MHPSGFDTVLCPVDFSELSGHALREAARLVARKPTRVIAAYANWFEAPAYFTEGRIEELKAEFTESVRLAERALETFVKSTLGEQSAPVETRVVEGLPADAIRKLADEVHADAIVMGTHGRTGYNRWMLGSVAERVLRESPVPVLTVRAAAERPIRHILCPVSDTQTSREALSVAVGLAARLDATVTALHVVEPHAADSVPNLCSWIPAEDRARCNIRELVRHGDAAEEIVAVALEEPYDLIVLGAPRRRFFEGLVLGTTTLRTVRHAPCPVLTVGEPHNAGRSALT
jgi:nucleotide-binding universal stress UspA family protein